ncbi:MAG: 2-oxoglutarate and iron-dependent oxygenase domain-containing protein [Pseudomonadota bacterium]
MSYAKAEALDAEAIPVIDLAPLREGTDPESVAKALQAASTGLGFLYVRGHGIPETVIETARAEAYAFFRAPATDKEHVRVSERHRGWIGQGGAKMQDGARPDLKESFIWGLEDAEGRTPEDHALRGPNRWPASHPGLRPAGMAFFEAAHALAHHLMRGFALGLDLAPDAFLKSTTRPLSRASFVYYPPQPADLGAEQFGVGPHTDFGVLTILAQDDVGGLQIQGRDGAWLAAPPIPGTLVVNVADLLARWTDGAYVSTPHRVVNASGRERLSLVLAYDPDPETLIDPKALFGSDHTTKAEPITCGDYLIWRFGKAFAYRKG